MNAFNYFDEIDNFRLRIYNMANYLVNLQQTVGKHKVEEYVTNIKEEDRKAIYLMLMYIRKSSPQKVKEMLAVEPLED